MSDNLLSRLDLQQLKTMLHFRTDINGGIATVKLGYDAARALCRSLGVECGQFIASTPMMRAVGHPGVIVKSSTPRDMDGVPIPELEVIVVTYIIARKTVGSVVCMTRNGQIIFQYKECVPGLDYQALVRQFRASGRVIALEEYRRRRRVTTTPMSPDGNAPPQVP